MRPISYIMSTKNAARLHPPSASSPVEFLSPGLCACASPLPTAPGISRSADYKALAPQTTAARRVFRSTFARESIRFKRALAVTLVDMRQAWSVVADSKLVQGLLLAVLLSWFPLQQLRTLNSVADADIWWHIRVGQWIMAHHGFPHTGIFSAADETRPWAAYSWIFELMVATLNSHLGLSGITVFVLLYDVTFVLVLFLGLRSISRSFWWAFLLCAVAIWAMDLNRVNVARPVSLSVLFLTLEVLLIFRTLEARNPKPLYWLPLLFLAWANSHIQFLYGLVLPGLLAVVTTIEYLFAKRWPQVGSAEGLQEFRPARLWAILAGCLAATLINPYTVGLYRVIFNYMRSSYTFNAIVEFRAPNFRESPHYVQLLLVGATFFMLGRRRTEPYKLALLTVGSLAAFRSVRDIWFLCIPAVAILASLVRNNGPEAAAPTPRRSVAQLIPVLAAVVLVITLGAIDNGFSERALLQVVRDSYPLDAANFIQEHHLPGPLYNNFNWGGFLIGMLPNYPVSIDGRTDLYGDEYIQHEIDTLLDRRKDNPALDRANVVLLPTTVPLAGVLQSSPQFKLVYSDKLAMVFVRER